MIILSCSVADFAGTVVGGQKVCVSWADKCKFCRANFWNTNIYYQINQVHFSPLIKNISFLPADLWGSLTQLEKADLLDIIKAHF